MGCARRIVALGVLLLGTGGDAEGAYISGLSDAGLGGGSSAASLSGETEPGADRPVYSPGVPPPLLDAFLWNFGLSPADTEGRGASGSSHTQTQSNPNPALPAAAEPGEAGHGGRLRIPIFPLTLPACVSSVFEPPRPAPAV